LDTSTWEEMKGVVRTLNPTPSHHPSPHLLISSSSSSSSSGGGDGRLETDIEGLDW